ncbi:MAG TPA: MotA/TolQ/ExbB proton channel family protein [Deltaproteobacteria bacterium]|nr:MotA/TolQ/ExbB proton channel family protein [Deltaproteobacteria bacterium]
MELIASFFREGGMFIWFILLVSIVGFAIMVERGVLLIFRYNLNSRALWAKVEKFVKDGHLDRAEALCANSPVPLMRILHRAISAASGTEKDIQNAVDEAALEVIPSIDKRVPYLATLANIATLLGLLGTIQGLIQAFAAIGSADPSQKASLLASGISIALYSTAFGLIVAIPMLVMYSVLLSKAHRIIDEIDEFSIKIINLLARYREGR